MAAAKMFAKCSIYYACLLLFCSLSCSIQEKSFSIDYNNNTFVKDGKPFRYISGSLHYQRVPYQYWGDRLHKMAAAGLNAVQTYVAWNSHEPTPQNYDFTGQNDIAQFLQTAQQYNLSVILRPGPYICAEWEFGGLPAWLMISPDIRVRTSDPQFIQPVDRWLTKLYSVIKPLLHINGGPIITVQIENEYGSYYACDYDYLRFLRLKAITELGPDVVLFTTDGDGDGYLKCGTLEGLYTTVDFGVTYDPASNFKVQREWEPQGPLVNSEFYSGWLDHWGQNHSTTGMKAVAHSLDLILALGANINMYMFEGGTNFAFWSDLKENLNTREDYSMIRASFLCILPFSILRDGMQGANYSPFGPVPTSYDYDAPLSEAGDITDKYDAIRQVISKAFKQYLQTLHIQMSQLETSRLIRICGATFGHHRYGPVPTSYDYDAPLSEAGDITHKYNALRQVISKYNPTLPVPPSTPKAEYGKIEMQFVFTVQSYINESSGVESDFPICMELLQHYYGFTLYRHKFKRDVLNEALNLTSVRDRAYVSIGDLLTPSPVGVVERETPGTMLTVSAVAGQYLHVLVENQGRINYGNQMDNNRKGLVGNVMLKDEVLSGWDNIPVLFGDNLLKLHSMDITYQRPVPTSANLTAPSFFLGKLMLTTDPEDTYFDMSNGWQKGQLFINGHNLGRYWPKMGPQVRLYVPKYALKKGSNTVIMLELEHSHCTNSYYNDGSCYATFKDKPYINETVYPSYSSPHDNLMFRDGKFDVHMYH